MFHQVESDNVETSTHVTRNFVLNAVNIPSPERKRPLGRHRYRRKNHIKIHLKNRMGGMI
jgi:hypothetical protein